MTRKTINRGEDGDLRYELTFEPGAREAKLACFSPHPDGATLTPRLAEDLIADLTIFVDQAKGKRRAPKAPKPEAPAKPPESAP